VSRKRNWPQYNRQLVQRGSLTFFFDEETKQTLIYLEISCLLATKKDSPSEALQEINRIIYAALPMVKRDLEGPSPLLDPSFYCTLAEADFLVRKNQKYASGILLKAEGLLKHIQPHFHFVLLPKLTKAFALINPVRVWEKARDLVYEKMPAVESEHHSLLLYEVVKELPSPNNLTTCEKALSVISQMPPYLQLKAIFHKVMQSEHLNIAKKMLHKAEKIFATWEQTAKKSHRFELKCKLLEARASCEQRVSLEEIRTLKDNALKFKNINCRAKALLNLAVAISSS